MNNETIKKFDFAIKLRGDNIYDLYLDGNWLAARGSCDTILEEARDIMKESLIKD